MIPEKEEQHLGASNPESGGLCGLFAFHLRNGMSQGIFRSENLNETEEVVIKPRRCGWSLSFALCPCDVAPRGTRDQAGVCCKEPPGGRMSSVKGTEKWNHLLESEGSRTQKS